MPKTNARNRLRRRYICAHGIKTANGCPKRRVNSNAIEPVIWKTVTDFLTDPAHVYTLIQEQMQDLLEGEGKSVLDRAKSQLNEVEAERGRVLMQHQQGYIFDTELSLKMQGIEERLEHHLGEFQRLSSEGDDSAAILKPESTDRGRVATGRIGKEVLL